MEGTDMQTFKKSVCAVLVCLILLACLPMQIFAAGRIDTTKDADLTIHYVDNGQPIVNAQFDLYLVADVDEYARMTLKEEFKDYPIAGLDKDGWLKLAATLKGYVQRDHIKPVDSAHTDENGTIAFPTEGKSLKAGLYLVIGYRATTPDFYTYCATPFMVCLPGENLEENVWEYSQIAEPKFSKDFNPPDEEGDKVITRKAIKIWDDEGYDSLRPENITVQLLCDSDVYDEQLLNKENNWRYSWDNLEPDHDWYVVEKEMREYALTIELAGITFTLTNKYIVPVSPDHLTIAKKITGDTPETAGTFTFLFEAQSESNPMPGGAEGTVLEYNIEGAGYIELDGITFTEPGIYVYSISEKNTALENYTYDTTVYTVTYEVTLEDGELKVKTTITDNAQNAVEATEFNNVYTKPQEALPQTGLLWWPVPLLLCLGLVLLIVGVIRRKSKAE